MQSTQSPTHQLLEAFAVVSPDWSEGDLDDLVHQSREVGALKGPLQAGHLVEDAAQGPDVTLSIVVLAFALGGVCVCVCVCVCV